MPRHIKTAALAGQQEEADAKVRGAVEAIIADVKARSCPVTRSAHSWQRCRRRRSTT
jgi:hypothetical protein